MTYMPEHIHGTVHAKFHADAEGWRRAQQRSPTFSLSIQVAAPGHTTLFSPTIVFFLSESTGTRTATMLTGLINSSLILGCIGKSNMLFVV